MEDNNRRDGYGYDIGFDGCGRDIHVLCVVLLEIEGGHLGRSGLAGEDDTV